MCDGRCMKPCRNRYCSNHHEEYVHKFCKTKECECTLVPCKNVKHCNAAFLQRTKRVYYKWYL